MSVLPAAAAEPLRTALAGPDAPARVLGVSPAAAYLQLTGGDVVALLAQDAARLPFGLVVLQRADERPWAGLAAGMTAVVGTGRVACGPLELAVARWWAPRRARPPRSGAALRAGVATLAAGLPPCPDAPELPPGGRYDPRLLGLGPGLTPYGDDVLAGRLLAATTLSGAGGSGSGGRSGGGGGTVRAVSHLLALAPLRTTAVSAACLRAAARGLAVLEATTLLDALGGHGDVSEALTALLAVGATSGHGLALGVLTGLSPAYRAVPGPRPPAGPGSVPDMATPAGGEERA